jgi:hypothetical protein
MNKVLKNILGDRKSKDNKHCEFCENTPLLSNKKKSRCVHCENIPLFKIKGEHNE